MVVAGKSTSPRIEAALNEAFAEAVENLNGNSE